RARADPRVQPARRRRARARARARCALAVADPRRVPQGRLMARTLLPVVGGVLGGMVGGPMGARIGFAAGSVIGSIVDPVQVRGPSIGETGAQTSAEGAPRA